MPGFLVLGAKKYTTAAFATEGRCKYYTPPTKDQESDTLKELKE